MSNISYLQDKDFLKSLDNDSNKFYWVKIEVLNAEEISIAKIEGRVQPGSTISINGSSNIRRTCNITFIAEEQENDLTDVDNLLSINKRIKIEVGIENHINDEYDDIIWFPQGIFIINQPNISHNLNSCLISLSCKDKMCLLDGSCGGNLPTSITFDSYDQIIGLRSIDQNPTTIDWIDHETGERTKGTFPNNYTIYKYENKYYYWSKEEGWDTLTEEQAKNQIGTVMSVPQRIYDIIQTLVHNYGGIPLSKIFINDIPLELKQLVRWTGSTPLYYIYENSIYTVDTNEVSIDNEATYRKFLYNEDVGYMYTDFTYPGSLVSSIGENVASVLTKIKNTLGNYEFFFDVNGNFIFQEVKNYLNTSYSPVDVYRLDNQGQREVEVADNGLSILDDTNYRLDLYSNTKSVYTFNEGNGLIISYQNSPDYSNIKNDFHIWGTNGDNGLAIHYHLAIKEKPSINEYKVAFVKKNGLFTGGIRLQTLEEENGQKDSDLEYDDHYIPSDWRAELYLRGLAKQKNQQRPDIYEQELLDLFDMIYDFRVINKEGTKGSFRTDIINTPNDLSYWFDYISPVEDFYQCSIDNIDTRLYSCQEDKIHKLFTYYVPNCILINTNMDSNEAERLRTKCYYEGQTYTNIEESVAKYISIGTYGYTAQDTARELLYQYTNYNESISLQSIPIYYLDVNSRITVQDQQSGIFGDYIIKNINLPLSAENTMSISATRALERI